MSDKLQRFTRPLSPSEIAEIGEVALLPTGAAEDVLRAGAGVPLDAVDHLMADFERQIEGGVWSVDAPELSDAWLAPRLHWALRLTRADASDRGAWHWLARVRYPWYVDFRWTGAEGVNESRWLGPIHKQALARLWWGAELFRDGPDYTPVGKLFQRQDLPNSYLHREFTRCRPLALGLVEHLTAGGKVPKATEINDIARVVNLVSAGSSPEAETGYFRDSPGDYNAWVAQPPSPTDWASEPQGPPSPRVPRESLEGALQLAARADAAAPGAAAARGSRTAQPSR